MNDLLHTIITFSKVLKTSERKLFFGTIVKMMLRCSQDVHERNTKEFQDFAEAMTRITNIEIVNKKRTQKIKGSIKIKNKPKIKKPDVNIDGINIKNKQSPTDYLSARFTDGDNLIDL